ncbi:MAG: hypothetical protein ABUR63_08930 [Verrucomicrobiota bacterium]
MAATLMATAATCAGCAKRIGEQAAAGAIQTLQAQRNAGAPPLRTAGQNATTGVIDALDSPEQQARLRALVTEMSRAAASAAVDGATRRLFLQVGSDGSSPLAAGVANAATLATTAAVAAAGAELPEALAGCHGPDSRACLERELNSLARSTATGFTAGIRDTLGWPIVVFAFFVGMAAGLFAAWAWSLRGRRRWLRTA